MKIIFALANTGLHIGQLAVPLRLFVLALATALLLAVAGQADAGQIRVEGNQRIEVETVRQLMRLKPDQEANDEELDKALKALFESGLFADVEVQRDGPDIVVRVVENPIINRIAFEGNRRISDEDLRSEIELRPRIVFTRPRVQRDVQRIIDIYRRSGRYTASVEPKVVQLPQNRLDLVFEITEGSLTEIRSITFTGNRAFDDGDLREVIQTKESAWYRIFSSGDTYDPDRLDFDRELLRRHYLSEGYADFRVITAAGELTPEKDAFFITFSVSEGSRYKFGKIDIESALKEIDIEALRAELTVASGDWYDAEKVENTIGKLTDALGNQGYALAEVQPRIERDRGNLVIDVSFVISESARVVVERIDISGNIRTEDSIIRREMLLVEGDIFNTYRLRRSRQRITNLGFFDKIDVTREPGSAADRTVIKIAVRERATGELSVGLGYSTEGGALTDLNIRERNLLGRGQDLQLNLKVGAEQTEIVLAFTEPYFLEKDLSAGFDIFRTTDDLQDQSSYDSERIGFGLRAGYRITEPLSQRWTYTLEQTEILNVGPNASRAVREEQGKTTTSSIGQILLYDTRDNRFDPNEGYSVQLRNVFAGLGGDRTNLRNEVEGDYFQPLTEDLTLIAIVGAGYILDFGEPTRLSERYFLGGSRLRGFRSRGTGPRDQASSDALGGNWFYRASLRLSFPLGLPDELGLKGSVFSDAGTLSGIDVNPAAPIWDESSLRATIGAGLSWVSPVGPMTFNWAWPIAKESFDKTEVFRLGIGTRF